MPPISPRALVPAAGDPVAGPVADARIPVMAWLIEIGQQALQRMLPAPSVTRIAPRR